ncbi:hypothetical protein [uncultured Mailhella sp.]|uniref:hypothetical protein n=1 Tax=uncultured Mailhella sp. TaxID=1981031 RepID=UPI00262DF11C|nr:hypothetical protein [uncultured Mailhella sp.]
MDFSLWASGFPGLLWELEHRRSRLRLLNNWTIPALGEDTSRLLKDVRFRRQVVMKSDHTLLTEFWDMVTSRQPAGVSFRLAGDPRAAWLLQGWPDPQNPEKYFGMLKEAVLPVTFVVDGTAETCQLALGHAQYPVLVLRLEEREFVTCNEAAQKLFSGAARGGGAFTLGDIAPGEMGETLVRASRLAVEEGIWAGTLMLRSGSGSILGSKVRISPCSTGTDVVRIALLNIPDRPASCALTPHTGEREGARTLKEGLEKLLEQCPGVDGLMFSDIQSARGRVEVYGVGRLFASLGWGSAHAYEGTIAQDIERFGLESLTVEDTLDSIKSIDWAMFIPCGVRSYFAKPFYAEDGLHAVLIFAFSAPSAGTPGEANFQRLYEPFDRLVARWRAGKTLT